jgi:cytochrome d ubiquinol oxidase subunit I
MSFLACNNFDCKVQGVNDLQAEYQARYGPGDYVPLMVATYWSFRIMVGLGFTLLAASAFALLVVLRNWSPRLVRWLKWMPYLIPLPFLAGVAGWVTTEMGRQPWIVQGLLTTAQAVSPALTVLDVSISLIGFTILYGALTVIMVKLLYRFARQGTEAALKKSVNADDPSSPLIPLYVAAQD